MQSYSELLITYLVNAYTQGTGWQSIAQAVRPFVSGHVTDIGGGLGFLANELRGTDVTVVERDALACGYLRTHHEPNVHLLQGDAHRLQPERRKGDVICCNYGSLLENLVLARKWGDRNLIVIARDAEGHRFHEGTRPNPACRMRLLLQSLSIPYQERRIVADMGQPFHDQEEVQAFSLLYGHTGKYPLQRREGEFPLWLPMVRPVSLLVVSIDDIPDLVAKSTLLVEGEQGVGKSTFVGKLAASADGGFLTKRVEGKVYLNPLGEALYDDGHLVGICGGEVEFRTHALRLVICLFHRGEGHQLVGSMQSVLDAAVRVLKEQRTVVDVIQTEDIPAQAVLGHIPEEPGCLGPGNGTGRPEHSRVAPVREAQNPIRAVSVSSLISLSKKSLKYSLSS